MVVGDFSIELDTVVIGAGPGGYVAAIRAAEMGQKVAVVEREYIGGVCLNVGCIPSKALISAGHHYQEAQHSEYLGVTADNVKLDFAKTQEWKQNKVVHKLTSGVEFLLKKHNIEILRGEAFFTDENHLRVMNEDSAQSYSFNNAIIATGSRPIEIPGFKFGGRVIDSTGCLNLEEVPKDLVIIGGGVIGSELGEAYANLGSNVTILEGTDRLLGPFDEDMSQLVERHFQKQGVHVITDARAQKAEDKEDSVEVTYEVNGDVRVISADYVMVSVGRRPNTDDLGLEMLGVDIDERGLIKVDEQGHTNVKSLWAIGDVVAGPALAHKASYEGKIVAEAISGEKVVNDYRALPAAAFTEPELATTGISLKEAKDMDDVEIAKFGFGANGRALSLNETEGFIRLITRKSDGLLLGAQIAGPSASDLISELTLAIEGGMNAEDIALTIHPHPSLSEAIMDCSEVAIGMPIHI